MQTKSALVRAESGVELHAVAFVDLALALVVLPDNAELDDALGNGDDLEGLLVFGVLLEERRGLEGGDELCGRLVASGTCNRGMLEPHATQQGGQCGTYPSWLAQTQAQTL